MKSLEVIKYPIVTEKATKLAEKMAYMFAIHSKATKIDVKMAIKELYGHDVAKVQIVKNPVKTRIMRRALTNRRDALKKAIITLKGKKKMDVNKIVKEAKK
jgi:large subunit ribosomal protein L23